MRVCMFVSVFLYTCVCSDYVCMYMYVCPCLCVYVYVCMHVRECVSVYVCM